jgi:hypothetical protein
MWVKELYSQKCPINKSDQSFACIQLALVKNAHPQELIMRDLRLYRNGEIKYAPCFEDLISNKDDLFPQ